MHMIVQIMQMLSSAILNFSYIQFEDLYFQTLSTLNDNLFHQCCKIYFMFWLRDFQWSDNCRITDQIKLFLEKRDIQQKIFV